MAQGDAMTIYFVILAAGHNRASYFVHLLENIFIIKNMELKLEKNLRIFFNSSFYDLVISVLWMSTPLKF